MDDKLKKEISKEVDMIFAGKKEDEMRKRTESALEESATTIESLSSDLESEREKSKELEVKLTASKEVVKTLEDEKSVATEEVEKVSKEQAKEVEVLKKELNEKSEELTSIKKDAVASERMEILTEAGVARKDVDEQVAKVRELSSEDFISYKEELVSIRESVLAELKESKKEDSKEDKEEKAEEKAEKKEEVVTPPANIDPGSSVAAALNMEIYPSDDIIAKYTEMGKAMAEAMTKDK